MLLYSLFVYLQSLIGLFTGFLFLTHHAVGGVTFGTLIFFVTYDYYFSKNKEILKVVPFLLAGVIIALVFLIPAIQIKDTLNFAVQAKSVTNFGYGDFRPLRAYQFFGLHNVNEDDASKPLELSFDKAGTHGEYIGILSIILILATIVNLKKKNEFNKYLLISLFWLIILQLPFLIPDFIKPTIQTGVRSFSLLAATLSLLMVSGLQVVSDLIIKNVNKYKIYKIKNIKTGVIVISIVLLLGVIVDYHFFRYDSKNTLEIPNGVFKFYENISNDKEYYRIEDQTFAPFGSTPIVHKHGVLNGAPSQEAPKYHFWLWSMAWELLKTESGAQNFASLYGTLSIKYFISQGKGNLPYFDEVKCGNKYCIYVNTKFLKYVRTVPNAISIPLPEPQHIAALLNLLSQRVIPFDKLVFAHTEEQLGSKIEIKNASTQVTLLEKKPGSLRVRLTNATKGEYLVIAESYHPYWEAYQDDKQLKIYEGIPSTLVIPVEKDGIVEVKFPHTKTKILLLWLSIITVLVLIGLIIYDYKYNKKLK